MNANRESEPAPMQHRTNVERTSDCEFVVTRTINGPAPIVFKAWTTPALFQRWWIPESLDMTLVSCEMDVRVGGGYRLEIRFGEATMAFFGRYLDVTPPSRLVWTNDEGGGEGAVTTVTFEEKGGKTLVTVHDRYPTKEALDEAIASGATSGMPAQLEQLDEFLGTMGASLEQS